MHIEYSFFRKKNDENVQLRSRESLKEILQSLINIVLLDVKKININFRNYTRLFRSDIALNQAPFHSVKDGLHSLDELS